MPKVKEVVEALESRAPSGFQESYDNSGLHTGSPDQEVTGILVCLDVVPEVLDEALRSGCNLVVSHHPPFFSGMKNFTGSALAVRILRQAIRQDLALLSVHTNLDSVPDGVSGRLAGLMGLTRTRVLVPRRDDLLKLVCFVPTAHLEALSNAVFAAGAGHIGQYDGCGFSTNGTGTFRAGEGANPFVGKVGALHREEEARFETIVPKPLLGRVISAMLAAHPYEEVAYDLIPLLNVNAAAGLGAVGDLPGPAEEGAFLARVKSLLGAGVLRHSGLTGRPIRRVAVCGGSGSEFVRAAAQAGADVYLTADIKYHTWFEVPEGLLVVDVGHYESEWVAMNILYDHLIEKFPTFAVRLTEVNTNPIKYL
ncbi:MAG: Nif3-like dinuclear metal center hexameric protein [Bacteroidales bacterium]